MEAPLGTPMAVDMAMVGDIDFPLEGRRSYLQEVQISDKLILLKLTLHPIRNIHVLNYIITNRRMMRLFSIIPHPKHLGKSEGKHG